MFCSEIFFNLLVGFAILVETFVSEMQLRVDNFRCSTYCIFFPKARSQVGFACVESSVTLYCPSGSISIREAFYGSYARACEAATSCCVATESDCTESVESNFPVDWAALQQLCQNQTVCTVPNPGRTLVSCREGGDFMLIPYSCGDGNKYTNIFFSHSV